MKEGVSKLAHPLFSLIYVLFFLLVNAVIWQMA